MFRMEMRGWGMEESGGLRRPARLSKLLGTRAEDGSANSQSVLAEDFPDVIVTITALHQPDCE